MDLAIPLDLDDLTPAWFAAALGSDVQRADVVDAHSGTTGRARVRVTAATGDAHTVFVKLAPFDERQRAFLRMTGIGVAEARFYATVGGDGTLPARAPRPWHAAFDAGADRYVMVLEDLVESGCTFPRTDDADIAEQAARIVDELAALHAAFWESDRFAGDLAWVPDRAGFGAGGGHTPEEAIAAGAFVTRALARLGDGMPLAFHAVGTRYASRTAEILDWWDEGERTLVHGDPHLGNQFRDEGRPGFYDWAMVSRSPGVRDLAYVLCFSIPPEVRRADEHDLLARYRDGLAAGGVEVSMAGVEQQYRLFAVFAWESATTTAAVGSRWQPTAAAMGAMHRATAAIEDLDCAGLLDEHLGAPPPVRSTR
jgi:Phosphotransferase enzyme family